MQAASNIFIDNKILLKQQAKDKILNQMSNFTKNNFSNFFLLNFEVMIIFYQVIKLLLLTTDIYLLKVNNENTMKMNER